ncbi:hypothetical protein OR1_02372 [Geobacter sp. OR-1]|uniref:hypothetical protein n=1 Tax=Geobacter sp. OR-1 TaxID=1266765 RepID=UPI0005440D88|nr:hypothetical protein [Geobacter sp. OR-1]GAM10085.1 hypothetical protein OR1_02372 [Geobacter sp. OR-1]
MSKRGKNGKDHGQLSLFPEEVPKWLLKEHDQVCDPYRGKTSSEGCLSDSYDDSDELAQFSDWLKRKGQ